MADYLPVLLSAGLVVVKVITPIALCAFFLTWAILRRSAMREREYERATLAQWARDHAKYTPPPTWQPRKDDPERDL